MRRSPADFSRWAVAAAAAVSLASPTVSAAATRRASPLAFIVDLSFTPRAADRLAKSHEGVIVAAYWYGFPSAAHRRDADEAGEIRIGAEQRAASATTTRVLIDGRKADLRRVGWTVDGKVWVNVNIFSARRSSPDNVLHCDVFDDPLAQAQPATRLGCDLIDP
jgi:hypothetical protein